MLALAVFDVQCLIKTFSLPRGLVTGLMTGLVIDFLTGFTAQKAPLLFKTVRFFSSAMLNPKGVVPQVLETGCKPVLLKLVILYFQISEGTCFHNKLEF